MMDSFGDVITAYQGHARPQYSVRRGSTIVSVTVRSRSSLRLDLTRENMGVSIARIRQKPETFPERHTVDSGVEGHDTNPLERFFEQAKGNLAPDTGPTESRTDIETPHPQRIRDDRVDRDPPDSGQDTIRVRGKQRLAGSIKTYEPRLPIDREPIEKSITFGTSL
jgi:hypothetical protein